MRHVFATVWSMSLAVVPALALPCAALGILLCAQTAWAVPVVDGVRDAEYGGPSAVQTVQTGFGDNLSELDAAYATTSGGVLYLMLTGNIEDNFNSLEIFIDSKAGGQNIFTSAGNAGLMDGLTFDAGFTADYHLFARRGNSGGDQFNLDIADLGAATFDSYVNVFGGTLEGSGTTGTGVNAVGIQVGYDDSNVAGVTGGTGAANQVAAAAVSTGLELGIALSDLGYVGGPIQIMAGINNADHNYWSNQFLAGLVPPHVNVGGDGAGTFTGDGAVNMNELAGNQYFNVGSRVNAIPEPATVTLVLLGLAAVVTRRTRRSDGG